MTYTGCVGNNWAVVNGVLTFWIFDFTIGSLQSPNPMMFQTEDPLICAAVVASQGRAINVTVDGNGAVTGVAGA